MLHVFLISLKTNPQETHANKNPVYSVTHVWNTTHALDKYSDIRQND